RPTAVPGIYALARLVAASGIADVGIVRVGADVTALAIVRERRVVGTRVFGLGRDAFAEREESRDDDALVWAEIVALPLTSENAPPSERWLFAGVPESLLALVVPSGAPLTRNAVFLEALRRRAGDRRIVLVSPEARARSLASSVHMKSFASISALDRHELDATEHLSDARRAVMKTMVRPA